ncbi:MAG: sulfotransferase family protein [Deltaproteobacteria bacterium]|nr:sulfotransferase family protein [Deltaproteobacteria bacterium]
MLFAQEQILIYHPGKCAGTTIEQLFLRALRQTNLARLLSEPSFNKANDQNLKPWWLEDRLRFMVGFLARRYAVQGVGGIYLQHADIYASLAIHGRELIDSLYKVAFVRNPFPRILSAFFYNSWDRKTTFRDFVLTRLESCRNLNHPFSLGHFGEIHRYTHLDGSLYVNFLGKLENIASDVDRLSREIGIPLDLARERKHARTASSKIYRHYSEAYDEQMVEMMHRLYQKDLEYFDYQFQREMSFHPRDRDEQTMAS